jgi:hypothetical protein
MKKHFATKSTEGTEKKLESDNNLFLFSLSFVFFVTSVAKTIFVLSGFHPRLFTCLTARAKNSTVQAISMNTEPRDGLAPVASARSKRLACVRG